MGTLPLIHSPRLPILHTGTLIDSFLSGHDKLSVLTDEQKNFVKSMKVLLKAKLAPPIKAPKGFRRKLYSLVTNFYFEVTITCLIVLNIIFMAMEYYNQVPFLLKRTP